MTQRGFEFSNPRSISFEEMLKTRTRGKERLLLGGQGTKPSW